MFSEYTLPSANVCDFNIGDIFILEDDGKKYILLKRDACKATVQRWYWWDELLERLLRRNLC
jgi:hypothetical protein